jgi:hypothetical protein
MKTLQLEHDYKDAIAGLEGQHPAPSHADQIISTDTVIIAPDGDVVATRLTQVIDPKLYEPAYEMWRTVKDLPSNRSSAIGAPSLPRIKKDGTLSPRQGVPGNILTLLEERGVRQGQLGYVDATPDQPCHKTPLTIARPELLERNKELILRVDALSAHYLPRLYAIQRAEVEKVPRWRLWDSAFTTIYIVAMLQSAYHTDSGNLRGVMSAIMPMGNFTGGELVMPRWRIAFDFKPGDLLLFNPQMLHGNLPFTGERLSAIFYCERRIADCGK